ncbi:VWA domain-containing protein [Clostridium sp. FP2]|uniref:VWA domain-containing protein n=1 Tax=Clostridium sp. FP2 TaxID=2724481 RepID=UPI0013E99DAE|nr:VWA domain-containing protein [Clostridium sp. FP2]MBZ9624851.1 VWA domain-containing protein [Clostridium sp. FP2]
MNFNKNFKTKKKTQMKSIGIFLVMVMIVTIFAGVPKIAFATTDNANGDWNAKTARQMNTSEAELMIRMGDIDNFGGGWPSNFNPFSGDQTRMLAVPSAAADEPNPTDRIMLPTGYDYDHEYQNDQKYWKDYGDWNNRYNQNNQQNWNYYNDLNNLNNWKIDVADAFTRDTPRSSTTLNSVDMYYDLANYQTGSKIVIKDATLQMYLGDLQPKNADRKSAELSNGKNQYTFTINGQRVSEIEALINSLDQTGYKGQLVTMEIPERFLSNLNQGQLFIKIDDEQLNTTGDAFAIDFVKLLINTKSTNPTNPTTLDLLDISRTTNASNIQNGNTFTVKYLLAPKPIPVTEFQPEEKKKDIVLVMDTSTSMNWIPGSDREPYYDGEKSRLKIIQDVAKQFVNKFDGNGNVNISLVEYNKVGTQSLRFTNMNSGNRSDVNTKIGKLTMDNFTNTGDGLRQAYYSLSNQNNNHDKYILLMTDGEANTYSCKNNWEYSTGEENTPYYAAYNIMYDMYGWNNRGNQRSDTKGLEYAKIIAKKIADSDMKMNTFIVGFGTGAATNNSQIATSAEGSYYPALDESSVSAVYNKIYKTIDSEIIASADFVENISTNLAMVDSQTLPYGLKQLGTQIHGKINDICYKLSPDKKSYIAQNPVTFDVTYKANGTGNYILGDNNSSFVNYTAAGQTVKKYFNTLILNGTILPEVGIQVTDSTGNVAEKYSVLNGDTNPRVDKFLNPSYLCGDAYANMSVKGNALNFFQYQFINQSTNPQTMPSANWNKIDLQNESYNGDVEADKPGKLKWRTYDVNHMATMSDEKGWNDPQKVFKYPSDATMYKTTDISSSVDAYGTWKDVAPYNVGNSTVNKRWDTNSVFMSYLNIGGDYKEASKFWGYIKVDQEGDYEFGSVSDDGCRGYITANGQTNAFTNMFKVQATTFGSTHEVVHLKADQYYPIHLEYFNWGGEAEFRMVYSKSGAVESGSTNVPTNWFYPSKSNAPGEYAENVFTGNAGVKLPTAPGNYYIAYQTGMGTDIQREGFYGPFIVENRLTLSKNLVSGKNEATLKEGFTLQYTITPNDVPLRDSFKNTDGSYKNTISLGDITLTDVYPQDIEIDGTKNAAVIVNGQSSTQSITVNDQDSIVNGKVVIVKGLETKLVSPINYTLSTVKGQQIYTASPIIIQIPLKAKVVKDNYVLSDLGKSILTYTELNGNMKAQMEFPQFSLKVDTTIIIIKHGMFINGVVNDKAEYAIVKGFSGNFGVEFETSIKSPNIQITIDKDFTISDLKLYKIIGNGQPICVSNIDVTSKTGSFNITMPTIEGDITHFIFAYKGTVKSNAIVGHKLTNFIKVGNSVASPCKINVARLPDLQ